MYHLGADPRVTGVQALDGLKLASKLMRGGRKQRQANEQAQQQAAQSAGAQMKMTTENRQTFIARTTNWDGLTSCSSQKISRPKRMSRVSTIFNSSALQG
jgi:hypothetical protein